MWKNGLFERGADAMSDYDELIAQRAATPDYNHLVYFRRQDVQPPGFEYVTRDDILLLSLWSPTASSTVQLSLRVLGPDGTIRPRFETLIGQTTGTVPLTLALQNMEGFLLSAQVVSTNAPQGQAYVTLEIVRGRGSSDATRGALLLAGYPDQLRSIGYPETLPRSSIEGRGLMRIVTGAVPAAGADISDAVPAGRQWILRGARFQLTAAVAVANRIVSLMIDDGAGNIAVESTVGFLQAAAVVELYSFAPGLAGVAGGGVVSCGFAFESRLLPGWLIRTRTQNVQAADQFTAAKYLVEEFITA